MIMKLVGGRINGTGAALYVCCGFVPDFVRLWVPDAADAGARAYWSKHFVAHNAVEGCVNDSDGASFAEYAAAAGISEYYGGDTLTSTQAGTTTYGEGVYLKWDNKDYRYANDTDLGIVGDAVAVDINKWTLDTAATPTGHFNEDVNGTYIGIGSRINIDGRWYTITVISGGESADEVELNYAAPSGVVEHITGMYSMKPMVAGETTPAGFLISATAVINVNDEIMAFEAGTYTR
jgi:hypothetical protein